MQELPESIESYLRDKQDRLNVETLVESLPEEVLELKTEKVLRSAGVAR